MGNFDNCNGHADDAGVQCQPGRQVDTELISRPFQSMPVSNDPNQEGLGMRLEYVFFLQPVHVLKVNTIYLCMNPLCSDAR